MKKLLQVAALFSMAAGGLKAGWNTPPPANVSVGTQVTVSASGSAYSGYNPVTFLVCWIQDPSGNWNHPVLGTGTNGGGR